MFEEKIKNFVNRVSTLRESVATEEATKTALIMPFFQILGYDVFNPSEFVPEYVADVGIKKGEKVDYAIILNNEPIILIEAKAITESLKKHSSQLFRYFATSKAKFAILTNGVLYRFFTDLDEPNKMDLSPFLEVNLLDLRDSDIVELSKFKKDNFDVDNIINTASDLKYTSMFKHVLRDELTSPSDAFVKLLITSEIYSGRLTQNIVDKFKPIVKKSISMYMNELVNDRLKSALQTNDTATIQPAPDESPVVAANEQPESPEVESDGIETTVEEIQSYYIIKSILHNYVDVSRITYKDTHSYFGVLLDGKVTRWICRVFLKENINYLIIPDSKGENQKYILDSIDDIYNVSDFLVERVKALL